MYDRRPYTLELQTFTQSEPNFTKFAVWPLFMFLNQLTFWPLTFEVREVKNEYSNFSLPTFLKFGMWNRSVILSLFTHELLTSEERRFKVEKLITLTFDYFFLELYTENIDPYSSTLTNTTLKTQWTLKLRSYSQIVSPVLTSFILTLDVLYLGAESASLQ